MVLEPAKLHVGRTIEKWIRRGVYEVRYDTAWPEVLHHCAGVPRPGQDGTWLNPQHEARLHHPV
jgi:leucyl/phenylalanyl-tRNA--protein transferase